MAFVFKWRSLSVPFGMRGPFSNDSHWAKATLSFRNDGHRTVISEGKSDLLWICRGFIRPPLVSEWLAHSPFGMIGAPSDMTASLLWLALLPLFGSRGDFPLVISEWKSFFLSFQKESFRQKSVCSTPDFNPPLFAWFFERKSAFRNGKIISKKLPNSYHSGRKIIS